MVCAMRCDVCVLCKMITPKVNLFLKVSRISQIFLRLYRWLENFIVSELDFLMLCVIAVKQ